MDLLTRVKAFLLRPMPEDLAYVPDSISERLLSTYAVNGRLSLDPELAELVELCLLETLAAAEGGSDEHRAYFQESAEILQAILRLQDRT